MDYGKGTNRLVNEKSPYLRQHAHNPVDWYPWGEEAFLRAREEDRPVFLSIGYSSCHWCHVMEQESFSDREVARLMNRAFVSIKVDREERPDLDGLYMTACQMITGSGGWPLSLFLTPQREPFFAMTYIPKYSSHGITGMTDLVPLIEGAWRNRRTQILESSQSIMKALSAIGARSGEGEINGTAYQDAFEAISSMYDPSNGGFGDRPKFPNPLYLMYLLWYCRRYLDGDAAEMVIRTLSKMRRGGVYDHAGHGFHRYSVDSRWEVPHFEKMLYDQALLGSVYAMAYRAYGVGKFRQTAEEILDFTIRDLASPEGGFFSALDADSGGVEGAFYTWEYRELSELLGGDFDFFRARFAIEPGGNFTEPGGGGGSNVLFQRAETAGPGIEDEDPARLRSCLDRLHRAREKREPPLRDEKILADWNGLMIASLASAGRALGESRFVEAAETASRFMTERLMMGESLYHRYAAGELAVKGFLDDYAFAAWGFIELYEAVFKREYLDMAVSLTETMLALFGETGLLYSTTKEHDSVVRRREIHDGVVPSGNAVAAMNLLRLGRIAGRRDLEERGRSLLKGMSESVNTNSVAHLYGLCASLYDGFSAELTIAGDPGAEDTEQLLRAVNSRFLPELSVVLAHTGNQGSAGGGGFHSAERAAVNGIATAYLCKNFTCLRHVQDPEELLALLENI